MSRSLLVAVFCLSLGGLVSGQAEMSSPALRTTVEEIILTTHFSGFVQGENYRLGIGTVSSRLEAAKIELLKGEAVLSNELVTFQQGFTNSWFNVDEILVQGYAFSLDTLPAQDERLTLKVTVSKSEAERQKKLFIILAKSYGPDVWYLQEGAELTDSLW